MHTSCPNCHTPIEGIADAPASIVCPGCGSRFQTESDSVHLGERPAAGERLGKFELLALVGTGAYGDVYKARDPELDRTVAIKIPRTGNLPNAQELDRF